VHKSEDGVLVRRCFRLPNAKSLGLTITLADLIEEEFRVGETIEAVRQEKEAGEAEGASFQELLLRRLSPR
jgi:hypothetical protein